MVLWLFVIATFLCVDQLMVDGGERNDELPHTANNRTLQMTAVLQITTLHLVDTITTAPLVNIPANSNNFLINLATLNTTNLTIVARTSEGVESVKFGLDSNPNYNSESTPPFSFCGNDGTKLFRCPWLVVGTHIMTAIPYSDNSSSGVAGTTRRITLLIVDEPSIVNDTSCPIPKVS